MPTYGFNDLVNIMAVLRSDKGCPWDREQTHESLKKYLIEETYEVIDEIDKCDVKGLCEELGDLMLQIVFHAQIEAEKNNFAIDDVISGICHKLISRHTHVFGDQHAETPKDVETIWRQQKVKEHNTKSYTEVLESIPHSLPALMRSFKVQKKASEVGFDWEDVSGPMAKVLEELDELKNAYNENNTEKIMEELGDLLFTVVNVSRFVGADPEIALGRTVEKFIKRFKYLEDKCRSSCRNLEDVSLSEMDSIWEEAKHINFEKNENNN